MRTRNRNTRCREGAVHRASVAALCVCVALMTLPTPAPAQTTTLGDLARRQESRIGRSRDRDDRDSRRDRDDDGRSRRSRRSSRRDDESYARNRAETVQNQDGDEQAGRARIQERTEVTPTRRSRASGRAASGGARTVPLPELKLPGEVREGALYFEPTLKHIDQGQRFAATVVFYNGADELVDGFEVWIHYNPDVLEPTWIDPEPLEAFLGADGAEAVDVRVWRDQGYVRVRAELALPLEEIISPLLRIHWQSLAPSPHTLIELDAPEGEAPAVFSGSRNIIDPTGLGSQGRVNMKVRINSPGYEEPGLLRVLEQRERWEPSLDPDTRVRLAIVADEAPPAPGEIGLADIVLFNPEEEPFDELKLRVRYNTAAVKVLDADEDNYIRKGINIFDGDFHLRFPFDYHVHNRVEPDHGVIVYHMGSTGGPRPYTSGVVARIVYRRLAGREAPAFWFEYLDPRARTPATDVLVEGRSLLGRGSRVARAALHGLRLEHTGTGLERSP